MATAANARSRKTGGRGSCCGVVQVVVVAMVLGLARPLHRATATAVAAFQLVRYSDPPTVGPLQQPRRRRAGCSDTQGNASRRRHRRCLSLFSPLLEDDGEEHVRATSTASTPSTATSATTTTTRQYDPSLISTDPSRLVRLPIFPLKKSVRFPTETLTLNLYEDRYVALAEDVLHLHRTRGNEEDDDDENPTSEGPNGDASSTRDPQAARIRGLFGAMYSGSCPHLVPAAAAGHGAGPITPLVERGDVGVMFGVDSYDDRPIPTLGSVPRRRIRLASRGLARFRVERVVEKGYETFLQRRKGAAAPSAALPYVVVDARLVSDAPISGRHTAELERRMRLATIKLFGMPPDEYLSSTGLLPLVHPTTNTDRTLGEQTRRRELVSFAVASRAMELAGAAARRELLLLDNPMERLRLVSY